jgi:phosphohistidine phosphatase
MVLFFLRHGKADPRDVEDEARQLTEAGRTALRAAAPLWRRLDLRADLVISSPRQRAIDSAELFIDGAALGSELVVDERLAPGARWPDLAMALAEHADARRVVFVGHEPDLSSSIVLLTAAASIRLGEGGLCRVEFSGGPEAAAGEISLLLDPELYSDEDA